MSGQRDRNALEQLIRLGHRCVTINTYEEEYAVKLVRDVAVLVDRPLWMWSLSGGVQDARKADGSAVASTDKPAAGLQHLAAIPNWPICMTLDLAVHLDDPRTLRVLRNLLRHFDETQSQLVMIDYRGNLPEVIASHATPLELSLPDEQELEQLVRATLRREHQQSPIEVDITRTTLQTIIRNLRGLTRRQAARIIADTVVDDRRFDAEDVNVVLARKRQALHKGGLLQFVEAPVNLDDIGGLRRLKQWLASRADALSERAVEYGIAQPRGVLMLGVQGAGKSLCAKAIATAWQRPLLRMDVGALYDRYVGESERRLRDALDQAEQMAPIILWIDEIEKAFASSASRSTDGGLSQRMFGALLTWMQEHTLPVFLVATANDIEALPPELLRKGRFDEIFFVDLPRADTRKQILAIHLRKRGRDPAWFDLDKLAEAADGFSGAEIEQAVIGALHAAFSRKAEVTTEHVLDVIRESPPLSVTMAERIDNLRAWADGRCVPAD